MELLEVVTVGLPYCVFKLLTGSYLLSFAHPAARALGALLFALGALDLVINGANLGSLLLRGRRALDTCVLAYAARWHAPQAPSPARRELGNSLDVALSCLLVAGMLGSGSMRELPPARALAWNVCVILNVLIAGVNRLRGAMRGALPALCLLVLGCAHRAPVVFLSDFGAKDSAVAVCKGVMWGIAPRLRVVDLTHQVEPYDQEAAGRLLDQTAPFYPPGTVFVAVVDPGVGSARRSIALKTKTGRYFVGPDNGMFAAVVEREGLEAAVELKETRYFAGAALSSTFHGRDVFAPVGAHLASGVALEKLGPPVAELARADRPRASIQAGVVKGEVSYVEDPYGNVVTDIPRALLEEAGLRPGARLAVVIGERAVELPFRSTFSDVPEGQPLALYHSRGALSFSLNMGDFAKAYGVRARQPVSVRRAD